MVPSATLARPLVLLIVLIAGCSGSSTLSMTRGHHQARLFGGARQPTRAAHATLPPAPEPPPGRPFAPTPLTDFAEQIADLALAAVQGSPLPPSPVPTRGAVGGEPPEVEWWPRGAARPRRLDVLAVAIEVDLVLKRGEAPDDATPVDRWGTLRTTFVVNRNGLRVVALRPAAMTPQPGGGVPPAGLEGLAEATRQLLAALRARDVSAFELTEDDRQLLANDAVWAQVYEDGPPLRRARDIARMLEGLPDTPLAYRLDDIGVLARDDEGRLYALTLELDPHRGSYVLTTAPLVRVRRLWPH